MSNEKKRTLTLGLAKKAKSSLKTRLSRKKVYVAPQQNKDEARPLDSKYPKHPYSPKKQSKNKHKLALRQLEKTFPKLFNLANPRPLDLGIREKLLAMEKDVSNKTVRLGLFFYCNSHQYLRSVTEGTARINAKGRFTKKVTKEEEMDAKKRLKELFKSIKSKKS